MPNGKTSQGPKILIIGAGFGGLATALSLEKKLRGNGEIILIDEKSEHVYSPLLYEVATGYLDEEISGCIGDLKEGVCVRYDAYTSIIGSKMIRFKHARVESVDMNLRTVKISTNENLSYDYLVIASGSVADDYGVKGVKENAFMLKTLPDALKLRSRLRRFVQSHMQGDQEVVSVVICGAGATGVELSAELANFFEKLRRVELIRHRHATITLVEAGPNILGPFDMTTRRWAENRLHQLGVEIMTETKVLEVTGQGVTVSKRVGAADEMVVLPANVVAWTGGVKPSDFVKSLSCAHDPKGRVEVDENLMAKDCERVYILGDCASVMLPGAKMPVPMLGQSAAKEAKVVAENIVCDIENRKPRTVKLPLHWNTVLPLGGTYAVAQVGSLHFRGRLGYFLRKCADFLYFISILPLSYAWHVFWRGARVYMKND